ncbi:squalene/phytoene synthase family protein [Sphingomonas sp. 4RDLI-65]|uniref:squalene/phytoene synthase family protein n=1 Tax=Sphingomonas sp. 4RDLI-65 TaxID=3111641 RepID=UPI003C17DA1E
METGNVAGLARGAERRLALRYAPSAAYPALEALFALDDTLAAILRTTREPLVGQMRLTWWYEALGRLDEAPAPAEPVLAALQALVLPGGVTGTMLASLTDGWEALLEPVLGDAAIDTFARDRGGRLFEFAGMLLGVADPRIAMAGKGWALADLSQRLSDADARTSAATRGATLLDDALRGRWPQHARALGAMALAARFDVAVPLTPPGSPKRVGRLLLHRLTGY